MRPTGVAQVRWETEFPARRTWFPVPPKASVAAPTFRVKHDGGREGA
jgi:hypothetical protein